MRSRFPLLVLLSLVVVASAATPQRPDIYPEIPVNAVDAVVHADRLNGLRDAMRAEWRHTEIGVGEVSP